MKYMLLKGSVVSLKSYIEFDIHFSVVK